MTETTQNNKNKISNTSGQTENQVVTLKEKQTKITKYDYSNRESDLQYIAGQP